MKNDSLFYLQLYLLILLLVLIRMPPLVLELHHQLLDLLLQLPVGLGRQHPLLGLGGKLLLEVADLRLQSGWLQINIIIKMLTSIITARKHWRSR